MQPKINTFFKRQATGPDSNSEATVAKKPKSCGDGGKVLNKKRNYGQFHLELGQPDFLLHMCAVCGMMYARGNDEDEKVHRAYHRSYSEGVSFKGWREETVVMKSGGGDRIILASGDKSCIRNSKVQEVIRVVEKELGYGEDQLVHKLCKVYLFVSGGRIVGCLVAEPIKAAHKVIPSSSSESRSNLPDSKRESAEANHTLEFGKISFKREVLRRNNHPDKNKEECQGPGAIVCEEEAVPALCGFRAIWVVPSRRRKGIASQLLDAARKSFCKDRVLGISQCAFTPPTSAGKELASSYYKTSAFLVYRDGDV